MENLKKIALALPHVPGVYVFRDSEKRIIYIGKAKDLKRRVSQYFSRDDAVGAKTLVLVSQITAIETIETHSEFDALLLEAKLIRENKPKYNVIAKDDKSPLYVAITMDEELPRILFVRKTSITQVKKREYFGPFQSGRTVRTLLRDLRRVVPYCTQKIRNGKPCFYTHLSLCSPCPSVIAKMALGSDRDSLVVQYRDHMSGLVDILSGRSRELLKHYETEMRTLADEQKFELAAGKKHMASGIRYLLEKHYDPAFYVQDESLLEHMFQTEITGLRTHLSRYIPDIGVLSRIECIDISNTSGINATGSLVVLTNGKADPEQYRRFRIRSKQSPDDFAMIAEVLRRRLRHTQWPYPALFVIDGGKGQVSSACQVLAEAGCMVPVIGLAKRLEEIIIPTPAEVLTVRLPLSDHGLHLLQRIRDEAHRFALTYHRKLRSKAFIKGPITAG